MYKIIKNFFSFNELSKKCLFTGTSFLIAMVISSLVLYVLPNGGGINNIMLILSSSELIKYGWVCFIETISICGLLNLYLCKEKNKN